MWINVHLVDRRGKSFTILLFSLVSLVDASGKQDGTSVGTKVGIAVGVLIALGFLIGLCYCCYSKDKDRSNEAVEMTGTACLETTLCYHD
ncbi:UNVERIFIED_CONTAM: hypothetical protein K2H54_040226 [Gekko kuhli]